MSNPVMKSGFGAAGAEILSVDQMYRADAAAIASGIPGEELMENAGCAVVEAICGRWTPRPVAILCGPGNNGGDGFVIARLLAARGWPVTVALLGNREDLSGDAALNAGRWDGDIRPLDLDILEGAGLVVDALFGAGLARDLDGMARAVIDALNDRKLPCGALRRDACRRYRDFLFGRDGNRARRVGERACCVAVGLPMADFGRP